jgi:hypothetical protein
MGRNNGRLTAVSCVALLCILLYTKGPGGHAATTTKQVHAIRVAVRQTVLPSERFPGGNFSPPSNDNCCPFHACTLAAAPNLVPDSRRHTGQPNFSAKIKMVPWSHTGSMTRLGTAGSGHRGHQDDAQLQPRGHPAGLPVHRFDAEVPRNDPERVLHSIFVTVTFAWSLKKLGWLEQVRGDWEGRADRSNSCNHLQQSPAVHLQRVSHILRWVVKRVMCALSTVPSNSTQLLFS